MIHYYCIIHTDRQSIKWHSSSDIRIELEETFTQMRNQKVYRMFSLVIGLQLFCYSVMDYSIVNQTRNNIRHYIISLQSVSVFACHNAKFLYPADSVFYNYSLCLLCFLLYLFSVLVSSILRFFFTGNTALRLGKSFSIPWQPRSKQFSTCDGVTGCSSFCRQNNHAAFVLSCDVLIYAILFLLCLPYTVFLQYVFSSYQNSTLFSFSCFQVFVSLVLLNL